MINHKLIESLEGVSLEGYVPQLDGGHIEPGVTIADGFDIGQHSKPTVRKMLPPDIAEKLTPYCFKTGVEAIDLLEKQPLRITELECRTISEQSHRRAELKLLDDWCNHSESLFHSLPDEMQTVIASVAYQYGNLPTRCPNFWEQAITQDWDGMLRNLWDFGDAYQTRRRKEHAILLWGVTRI